MTSPNGALTRVRHFGVSGLRAPVYVDGDPEAMARRVCRYIADPSSVRVRVLEHYGRAPSIEQIARWRADHVARLEYIAAQFDTGEASEWDEDDFVASSKPFRPGAVRRAKASGIEPEDTPPEASRAIRPHLATATDVIAEICRLTGITVEQLTVKKDRKRATVRVRNLASAVLRTRGNSWPMIAARVGLKDHGTCIYGMGQFFARDIADPALEQAFAATAHCVLSAARSEAELIAMMGRGNAPACDQQAARPSGRPQAPRSASGGNSAEDARRRAGATERKPDNAV